MGHSLQDFKKPQLPTRFLWLDGLRGVAALMVAVGHITWIPTNPNKLEDLGNPGTVYPIINHELWNFLVSLTIPSTSWVMIFFFTEWICS